MLLSRRVIEEDSGSLFVAAQMDTLCEETPLNILANEIGKPHRQLRDILSDHNASTHTYI